MILIKSFIKNVSGLALIKKKNWNNNQKIVKFVVHIFENMTNLRFGNNFNPKIEDKWKLKTSN